MPLRDTSERDAKLASCPRPHRFQAVPEKNLAEHLWRRRCDLCGAIYSGREYTVFCEGDANGAMRTEMHLAERFRDLEARYWDLTERLVAQSEQPHPAETWQQ